MSKPLTCPACSVFVRSDWTDICQACGSDLVPEPTFDPAVAADDIGARKPLPIGVVIAGCLGSLVVVGIVTMFVLGPPSTGAVQATGSEASQLASDAVLTTTTTTMPVTTTTQTTLDPTWVHYTDHAGRFTMDMPAKPNVQLPTSGSPIESLDEIAHQKMTLIMEIYPVNSAGNQKALLDRYVQFFPQTVTVSRKDGTLNGHMYADVVQHSPEGTYWMGRIVVTDRYVYAMAVEDGTTESQKPVFDQWAAGFALTAKA